MKKRIAPPPHNITKFNTLLCFMLITTVLKAQFQSIGPVGGASYNSNTSPNSGSGLGQIHCIAFAPQYNNSLFANHYNTLYCGSPYSGLWKSTNRGALWTSVQAVEQLPSSSVNDVVITNETNYTIYITTGTTNFGWGLRPPTFGSGLYKSTDFGVTFQPVTGLNTTFNFGINKLKIITKIAVSPFNVNHLAVATSDGVYVSLDKGVSWSLKSNIENFNNDLDNHSGIWAVEFSKQDPNLLYFSGKELYTMDNYALTTPVITTRINYLLPCNTNEANLNIRVYLNNGVEQVLVNGYYKDCATPNLTNGNRIYVYDWTGWSFISQNNDLGFIATGDRTKIAANPSNLNVIMAGNTASYVTTNFGTNWQLATGYYGNGHADIHAIEFIPGSSSSFLVGTDGGLFEYNVNTGAVTERNNGFVTNLIWQLSTSKTKKNHLAVGKQDTNGDWWDGTTWHQLGLGGDGYPPVKWDNTKNNEFFISIGEALHRHDINNGTTVWIDPNSCRARGGQIYQNPDPYKSDEFYSVGYWDGTLPPNTLNPMRSSIAVSNEPAGHATNFKIMDTIGKNPNWQAGFSSLYVSQSDPERVYAYNLVLHPSIDDPALFRFNKANYFNYKNDCSLKADKYNTALRYEQIKYLPASYYTTNVPCSLAARVCYAPNTELWKMHSINDIAISNTNANKIWLALEHNKLFKMNNPSFVVHKVRKSTDGGSTWSDDDAGLPLEAISKITYLDGSNDMLFCATFTGRVFYKDNTMTTWLELDPTLPHCSINTLEVNYCTKTLNIATYGRGVWRYNLTAGPIAQKELTINSTVNWSNKQYEVGSNIVVKAGGHLTIENNSIINMCKDCRIILEPGTASVSGGRLTLTSAAKLTNLCGEYWSGIEVQGDLTAAQLAVADIPSASYTKQARCVVTGNAIIELMKNGISNFNYVNYTTPQFGGQLFIKDALFNDNKTAIYINGNNALINSPNNLKNYYQSKIETSTFKNNTLSDFQQHLITYNLRGLTVLGCLFENNVSTPTPYLGKGINAFNSMLEITPYKPNATTDVKNQFKRLTYGVVMQGNGPGNLATLKTKIAKCIFEDNTYGIYLNTIDSVKVVENEIKVPILNDPLLAGGVYPPNKSYGIYLTGCFMYKVQNNNIYTTRNPVGNTSGYIPQPYGVLVSNGHNATEKIRRNTITKCKYGLVANGLNGIAGGNQGLLFQCNTLQQNETYDQWLSGYQITLFGTTYTTTGVIPQQGTTNTTPPFQTFASNNSFIPYSATLPQFNLVRNSFSSSYTYYRDQTANPPYNTYFNPTRVLSFYPIPVLQNGIPNSCLDEVVVADYTQSQFLVMHDSLKSEISVYDAKQEIWLKTILAGQDPQEVLTEMLESNSVSKALLLKIAPLVKNERYYKQVLQVLQKHAGASTPIANAFSQADVMLDAEDLSLLAKSIEGKEATDDVRVEERSAIQALIEEGMKRIFVDYMQQGKVREAFLVLKPFLDIEPLALFYYEQLIASTNSIVEKQQVITEMQNSSFPMLNRLAKFYTLALATQPDNKGLFEIAQTQDLAGFKAMAHLAKLNDTIYPPYLPDMETALAIPMRVNNWQDVRTEPAFNIEITPNPADKFATVHITQKERSPINFELKNSEGKKVYEARLDELNQLITIPTEQLSSGTYFLSIENGKTKKCMFEKLVVSH